MEIVLRTLNIGKHSPYDLNVDVEVTEEGTGEVQSKQSKVFIERTVLKIVRTNKEFVKPELPNPQQVS